MMEVNLKRPNPFAVFDSRQLGSYSAISQHEESRMRTTCITPFGKCAFHRLLSGITSAPKIFQRKIAETLASLEGTEIFMDEAGVRADPNKIVVNSGTPTVRATERRQRVDVGNCTVRGIQELKDYTSHSSVLDFYDANKPTIVFTDARGPPPCPGGIQTYTHLFDRSQSSRTADGRENQDHLAHPAGQSETKLA
ncbi:hypothetical protein FQN60_017584 [Etheostoma spectabile]|uniref:Uncharacterized protein n=1 Tax=Etheostoma spectabile TaxID=54343 RepID=A0A5J5DFV5_9PERO|nr:hypothetical protein FQN60_017584 [Etheostoma spectabile]